jgi:hypothetical protein
VRALEEEDVVARDDADQATLGHDPEMVDVAPGHLEERLEGQGPGPDRDQRRGHDGRRRRGRQQAGGQDLRAEPRCGDLACVVVALPGSRGPDTIIPGLSGRDLSSHLLK